MPCCADFLKKVALEPRVLEPADLRVELPRPYPFQGEFENHLFDFTVVDPLAQTYAALTVDQTYQRAATAKINHYRLACAQNGLVFRPMVFSAFGQASSMTKKSFATLFVKDRILSSKILRKISLEILVQSGGSLRSYWSDLYTGRIILNDNQAPIRTRRTLIRGQSMNIY